MDQRGRKGFSAGIILVPNVGGKHPEPPDDLTQAQKARWMSVIRTKPHDWFDAGSLPLLKQYVCVLTDAEMQAQAIDSFDPEWLKDENGLRRYTKLMALRKESAGLIMSLATKMRLTQQSRYTEQSAATAARRGTSKKMPWED